MTCNRCPEPHARQLAGEYLCDDCAETILQPIRERVNRRISPEGFNGVGVIMSPADGWGRGWWRLRCDQCSATWVGRESDACSWCADRYRYLLDEQRHTLLRPDLPDPDDARRVPAMAAWRDRLKNAVTADVISEDEARNAYEREAPRVAA